MTVYTVPQAAAALGKTVVTFKKWIADGLLPPPIFKDTTYGYMHYSQGEMKLVAGIIRKHEQKYDYLHTTHDNTVSQLWQAIEEYRSS